MRNTVIFAETATDQNIINNPRSVIYDEITYNNDPNNIRRNGLVSGEVMSTVLVNTTMRQNSIFAYFFTNVINDILTNYCGIDGTALQSAYRTITNESTAKSFADRYIGTVPSAPTTPNAVIPYLKQIDFILDGQQQIVESLSALNMVDTADGNTTKTIETRFEEFAQSVEQSGGLVTGVVNNYVAQSGNAINDTFTNYESGNINSIAWLNSRLTAFLNELTQEIVVNRAYSVGDSIGEQTINFTVAVPFTLNYTKIGNLVICTTSGNGQMQVTSPSREIREFILANNTGSIFPENYPPKNASSFETSVGFMANCYVLIEDVTSRTNEYKALTVFAKTNATILTAQNAFPIRAAHTCVLKDFVFSFYYVTEYTES